MNFQTISTEIVECAFKQKRCSVNCIYKLVETHDMIQIAKALDSTRANVYHTNAHLAHAELRNLLKFGQCVDTREVIAHFNYMGVLSPTRNTPSKIKVQRLPHILNFV